MRYSPKTGAWFWIAKTSPNVNRKWGDPAGHHNGHGYLQITVDKKYYLSHRLAWFYMTGYWPKAQIDHRDCDRANNAWYNLREATRSQNLGNSKKRRDGRVKMKGVRFHRNRYVAKIRVCGKGIYLGSFDTPEQAHAAYVKAAKKHFGEFARAA